jgi:hypothetical protein
MDVKAIGCYPNLEILNLLQLLTTTWRTYELTTYFVIYKVGATLAPLNVW